MHSGSGGRFQTICSLKGADVCAINRFGTLWLSLSVKRHASAEIFGTFSIAPDTLPNGY